MTKTVILFFLLTLSTMAQEVVDFKFKPEARFFDQLTADLRHEMPNSIEFSDVQIDDEGSLHLKLIDGSVDLTSIKDKLFTVTPLPENKIKIQWNFKKIRGLFHIRADWKVEILGVTIRKKEVFRIMSSQINHAESLFQIVFEEGIFQLKLLKNSNFNFNEIKVESTDDDVVTWVLEKLEEEVRGYLNEEIQDYFSGPKFSKKFQEMVEEDLNSLENINIRVSDYATQLKAIFERFKLDQNGLEFKLKTQFQDPDLPIHACAKELQESLLSDSIQKGLDKDNSQDLENTNPGTVKVSYSFVEKIVHNMSLYEVDENHDGHPDEPIFCFGYSDPDYSGKLENVTVKILGQDKNLKIKFWAFPTSKPIYNYTIEKEGADGVPRHMIKATMKAKVLFGSTSGYPKILFKDNTIEAQASMDFRLKVVTGKGLQILPVNFRLNNFDGKVYYKSKRFLPKIRIPFFAIKEKIEEELLVELKNSLSEKIIIDEVVSGLSFNVKLKEYQLRTDGHEMQFNVLYK